MGSGAGDGERRGAGKLVSKVRSQNPVHMWKILPIIRHVESIMCVKFIRHINRIQFSLSPSQNWRVFPLRNIIDSETYVIIITPQSEIIFNILLYEINRYSSLKKKKL